MGRKIKLTRPELKQQRDILARYERYLPTLKLKQQQLQIGILAVVAKQRELHEEIETRLVGIRAYAEVLAWEAGVDLAALARPGQVNTALTNIAGVRLPVFESAEFTEAAYSLFATAPWVDRALADLRDINRLRAEEEIVARQVGILHRELMRINQRLNLFEKVMIPRCREAIRRIRIYLGDEQTAAVGRAKIAKAKQAEKKFVEAIPRNMPEGEARDFGDD